jgi:hypothetical protein
LKYWNYAVCDGGDEQKHVECIVDDYNNIGNDTQKYFDKDDNN